MIDGYDSIGGIRIYQCAYSVFIYRAYLHSDKVYVFKSIKLKKPGTHETLQEIHAYDASTETISSVGFGGNFLT